MTQDIANPPDINHLAQPTEFEVVKALAVTRLLIEAYEAGEDPPEFAEAWSDDVEIAYDMAIEASLTTFERAAIEYRDERRRRGSRYGR